MVERILTGSIILSKLTTVDGAGSLLDADLLDGQEGAYYADIAARLGYTPLNAAGYTAADVLAKLLTVDGAASSLDADLLDGQQGSYYTDIPARLGYTPLNTASYTAADVLSKLLTVDGAGSLLDADLLDGQQGSYYADIPARLGYTPLNAASYTAADVLTKLLTVDGAASALDADLLDGQHGSYYADVPARLGYTPADIDGDTFTGEVIAPTVTVSGVVSGSSLIGGSTTAYALDNGTLTPRVQANGGGGTASLGAMRWSADASPPYILLGKSRNATFGAHTIVQDGDDLGVFGFDGSDGSVFRRAARIVAEVEGTPGADEIPARLTFQTRPTGAAAALASALILGADQRVRLGTKGTAALPGLSFDGDTDTGIYSHTDDDVSIATGGVRQWAVTAAGALVHTGGIDGAAPGGVALQLNNGLIDSQGTFDETGAASANLVVASGGVITKTSSSLRYKKDVETAEFERSAAIVDSIRPVWYRSRGRHDDPNDSFWGFIAEEVAEVDPRLVSYGHAPGTDPEVRRKTKPTVPDGVAYERFVVHLVATMQDARRRIAELEAKVAALENA